MATDPFANMDEKEETATVVEIPTAEPTDKEEVTMIESNSKIVTTIKHGSGFEAPWTVVHSDNVADAIATLNDPQFRELLDLTGKAAGYVAPKTENAQAPAANGQPQGATQAPGGHVPPPGYVYKSGVGKNGKPWQAFMPADRSSGLPVQWL